MTELYGPLWIDRYGDHDAGSWGKTLANVPDEDIGGALAMLRSIGKPFPPTLPEFIALCLRTMCVPDALEAYQCAAHLNWKHPVVYETARRVGVVEVRSRTEREIRSRFEQIHAMVCAEWLDGARFTAPTAKGVEHKAPAPTREEKESGARHMARIKSALNTGART